METTLAINPGSSSKKYSLYRDGVVVCSILFEQTDQDFGKCVEINGVRNRCEDIPPQTYSSSLSEVLSVLIREQVISDASEITRVGIRIVAPGTYFSEHRLITPQYEERLLARQDAAPLHIPHCLAEIRSARELLPRAKLVGVSDSAFHNRMPEYVNRYSISRADTDTFDLHRFGYHGLSMSSVVRQVTRMEGVFPSRVIVCHVGSGVSVTALKDGVSVDTTMGFGPTSGLMMNTRAGDLDPSALLYLMKQKQYTPEAMETYINAQGGLKGMVGQGDLRIALDRRMRGDRDANLAILRYAYGIRKAIGSFVGALGGVDMLVLTATAAERNSMVRALICEGLGGLGIVLDEAQNEARMGEVGYIHATESHARILVIHTNEMEEIARTEPMREPLESIQ